MRHHDFRRRIFLALGLPLAGSACAPPPPPILPPPPPDHEPLVVNAPPPKDQAPKDQAPKDQVLLLAADPPPERKPPPIPVATHPEQCGQDQVRENVCGAVASPAQRGECGDSGENLISFGPRQTLEWIAMTSHNPALRDFHFARERTAAYQETIRKTLPAAFGNYCCYERCTSLSVAMRSRAQPPPRNGRIEQRCVPVPEAGTEQPDVNEPSCPGAVAFEGVLRPFAQRNGASCCYDLPAPPVHWERPKPMRGRPARVEGVIRRAEVRATGAWQKELKPARVAEFDEATRASLSAAWLEDARMEHASIASFAKLSLELLACGAPPSLIEAAHLAALDEVEHARLAFALASAYAGRALGPAPFADVARMVPTRDLSTLALETLHDGCVAETIATIEAERAVEDAEDPAVRGALLRIAKDEARHAELGWRILAWAARTGEADVVSGLREARAALAKEPLPGALEEACCVARSLGRHGRLCAHVESRLRAEVIAQIVLPCLDALLEDTSTEERDSSA